jgi:APA family basic amino acid/polyamine antiporter
LVNQQSGQGHAAEGAVIGVSLKRSLTLGYATMYGLGVTIGAGIYVLIGAAAARAGMHAPLAFLIAAVLMGLTAASFAELGSRMPVSASEAAYARAAFGSDRLALLVGLLVVGIAVVSAAAISVGSAGYIRTFIDMPQPLVVCTVVIGMGAVAAWGIVQSVAFAGVMTLIEIGGLLLIVLAGSSAGTEVATRLPEMLPPLSDYPSWLGVSGASLLAVFAFVGFEGLVNVSEEMEDPRRTLPRAIFLTLAITTVLYVAVAWVALVSVGPQELAASPAPLALVFERLTGLSPTTMSAIAIVATLNGIIVQIIMSSRVLYGLSAQKNLPPFLSEISPATRTPLYATALSAGLVLALALVLQLEGLADLTSRFTLVLFAVVNLSLIRIKAREQTAPRGIYIAPKWLPWAGLVSCLALLLADVAIWTGELRLGH